jgi:hypothetical protein
METKKNHFKENVKQKSGTNLISIYFNLKNQYFNKRSDDVDVMDKKFSFSSLPLSYFIPRSLHYRRRRDSQ